MLLEEVLADLRGDPAFMNGVCHWRVLPARGARTQPFPGTVDARLRAAWQRRGIAELYAHQAGCFDSVRAGRNVVLVTPTASGKTLAYNLPILQHCIDDAGSTAIYLFPTKALAQDQHHELLRVLEDAGVCLPVATYDGDTPAAARRSVRAGARLMITNPDMLHTAVLPHHPQWERFFRGLRFVVIDELHTYRGIFGSHLTNVLRRLRRLTAFYRTRLQFLCCSATIGNPRELAERIVGQPVELIDTNGAPSGARHFVLYNPPLVDRERGIRRSVVLEAQSVAARLLRRGVKTIVFARSRVRTELIASYVRQRLMRDGPGGDGVTDGAGVRLASYRGGYLPRERRAIERGLRAGTIDGVVATTALELGVDIGTLEASVLAGFPGTIAATWQQAGRAGRRSATSLSILIASASPIDQFLIRHPEYLFAGSPESGRVDPDNVYVLLAHLKCAAFERPLADAEVTENGSGHRSPFGGAAGELLRHLQELGSVRHSAGRWYWTATSYPAEQVSLRTASPAHVVIVDATDGGPRVIGEIDRPSAKALLYPGAIYLHRGVRFIVIGLDLEQGRCSVQQTGARYFTEAVVHSDLRIVGRECEQRWDELRLLLADIVVRQRTTGFKKRRYGTHQYVGSGDVDLPADEMPTRAVVVYFPPGTAGGAYLMQCAVALRSFVLERVAVLVRNVAPLFLLCDPRDLGVTALARDTGLDCPAVYVYDACPGGSGLAAGLYHQLPSVLDGCRDLLAACACSAGVPPASARRWRDRPAPPRAAASATAPSRSGWSGPSDHRGKRQLLDAFRHLVPAVWGEQGRAADAAASAVGAPERS